MSNYIITYNTKINGENKIYFHESISVNENLSTNNVYVEHITFNKKLAQKFFDRDEAKKVANLFSNDFHIPLISII